MKKFILLIYTLCLSFPISVVAQSEFSVRIFAGSNAPWGETQLITINAKGNVKYKLTDTQKGDKDSKEFTITKDDLSKLKETLNTINFFQLEEGYNTQSVDGMALSVGVTMSGKTNEVTWFNIRNKETELLKDRLNQIFKKKGITIRY